MKILFWISLSLIFYCYFGYPLLITLVARFWGRKVRRAEILPTVSIVISVWNEEDVIENKIKNLLALDYPPEKLEIWIGSDCSTDRTAEIVRSFSDLRLHLVESSSRRGKPAMLADLLPQARGEIVMFTDARQALAPDALRELVKNFADPMVGCASGELMLSSPQGSTGRGIDLYWNYEKFIRFQESRVHSMLGATGAIYAIRRELFVAPPSGMVLDDMFIPFRIIRKGYRAVFDARVKAYDAIAESPREEYRRKIRTIAGNYQIFGALPQMFNPFQSPVAVQLFSHKFLRLVVPFLLILVFATSLALSGEAFYRRVYLAQILFYEMALIGAWTKDKKSDIVRAVSKLCYVPFVFCLLNFSALVGFGRFVFAKQDGTWEKARR